jgi:hypothetical protein
VASSDFEMWQSIKMMWRLHGILDEGCIFKGLCMGEVAFSGESLATQG